MMHHTSIFAADYYVDNTSDNQLPFSEATGSQERPWTQLQFAIEQLKAGDHLWVKPGTYQLDKPLQVNQSGQPNQPIVMSSLPGERANTVLVGAGFSVKQQSHITIQGFTIRQAFNGIYIEGSASKPVSHITLRNNHTFQTVQSGIAVWGVAWQQNPHNYQNLSHLLIEGNLIQQACVGSDGHTSNGYNEAITIANGVHQFEIRNNHVFDGGNPRVGGEGIDLKEGVKDGSIHHNHIYNLHRRGIYLDAGGLLGFTPPFVKNILIHDNQVYNIREAFDKQTGERIFEGAGAMALMTEGDGSISDIHIYNNQFYDTDEDGILIYQHPKGSGLVSDIRIFDNHIHANKRAGILVDFAEATSIEISNNHLYKNQTNLLLLKGSAQQYNNLFTVP
ncbi:right-handed parallel beta-helix repeat-containing protein [Agarivorans sp. TSD2052]|uniref:right-handed parallel beta-helix repeat-containing protein n=1 Tax=Agarivorans sp. TSD2052 TaxID=2937286 RepID=UPI00200FEB52|nr:right-handed parallel beta-helix repeat-containing protein [Agarivorans sp. TSD2052]UPW19617.1 right-handed parallel beta-helix repeat-containing protein [Agarivorans sp. TSD2052]